MGQRIKTLREARGWSQEYLGKLISVTGAAVSQWENDAAKNPKLDTFLALCEALGTDPHYLVFGADRGAEARSRRIHAAQGKTSAKS